MIAIGRKPSSAFLRSLQRTYHETSMIEWLNKSCTTTRGLFRDVSFQNKHRRMIINIMQNHFRTLLFVKTVLKHETHPNRKRSVPASNGTTGILLQSKRKQDQNLLAIGVLIFCRTVLISLIKCCAKKTVSFCSKELRHKHRRTSWGQRWLLAKEI